MSIVERDSPHPTLLMGDLNEWYLWGRPLRWLHSHFREMPAAPRTFPAHRPVFALDRIWVSPAGSLRKLVRRLLSIASLATLDVAGLALGIYGALVLREVVYGRTDILWSLLWEGPSKWLPFLAPVTILVFWQSGLYAARERRPGPGRVVSSLVLIALVVLAFGIGTDYDFTTSGLIPAATALSALAIGLLRAAYAQAP